MVAPRETACGLKVVGIVQARTGSTRLPGKVLMDLAGEPMLARVVRRLSRAQSLHEVIVATTTEAQDDAVAELARARGWPCIRGSRDDVLDRYYQAATDRMADLVVRVTGDCPFIEPILVDQVVAALLDGWPDVDLSSNVWPRRTFPRGLDAEALTSLALARVWREDHSPRTREHVTAHIYKNPQQYRIVGVQGENDLSEHRWTVDTCEDWALAECLYHHFGHDQFGYKDVLSALAQNPGWSDLNRGVEQKAV